MFVLGYGSIAPRTLLGKVVTMIYAILGIPLTLIYLSSIGTLLSSVARGVFSRALCCCLCSNCGYCCYDEKRMAEKERRMKKKRQQQELQQQLQMSTNPSQISQSNPSVETQPYYVRSNTSTTTHNNLRSPMRDFKDIETDTLSCIADTESKASSMHGLSILAPILLCLCMMCGYICFGAFALYKLENWSLIDGIYFCFMSLTTIGFGDLVPGTDNFRSKSQSRQQNVNSNLTIWFCSFYIMSGMALTAMCFNVIHEEIVHRLRHNQQLTDSHSSRHLKATNLNQFNENVMVVDNITNNDPFNFTS